MNEVSALVLGTQSDNNINRLHLLDSAKRLMAIYGYERTTLEAIAHDADVSEIILQHMFGSKEELLEAVFNDCWEPLNTRLGDIVVAAVTMREAALAILTAMLHTLGKDRDFERLILFESRRQHGNNCEIRLSRGFRDFESLLVRVFQRGQKDGSFNPGLEPFSTASALLGAAEGMLRDRVLAEMLGQHIPFSEMQLRATFEAMVNRLAA